MVNSLVQTSSGWIQLDAKVPRGVPSTLKPEYMWLCVPSSSVFCRHYDCFFRNINVGIDDTSLPDSTVLTLSFLPGSYTGSYIELSSLALTLLTP